MPVQHKSNCTDYVSSSEIKQFKFAVELTNYIPTIIYTHFEIQF